jgi:hypothetical protein
VFKQQFGTWGKKVKDYLNDLSKLSAAEIDCPNAEELTYYRQYFSMLLQKCTARAITKKLRQF